MYTHWICNTKHNLSVACKLFAFLFDALWWTDGSQQFRFYENETIIPSDEQRRLNDFYFRGATQKHFNWNFRATFLSRKMSEKNKIINCLCKHCCIRFYSIMSRSTAHTHTNITDYMAASNTCVKIGVAAGKMNNGMIAIERTAVLGLRMYWEVLSCPCFFLNFWRDEICLSLNGEHVTVYR